MRQEPLANQPFHICLLGPSGIGKSPLSALFRLLGFDPKRVRGPRDAKDKELCISEPDAAGVFQRDAMRPDGSAPPWPGPKAPDDWFVVGGRWLFFSVRGDRQCLEFRDEKGRQVLRSSRRVEIFGPRLLDILNDRDGSRGAVGLSPENLVVFLLNPSARRYDEMATGPDEDLKQATFYAIAKRTELQGKPVDVPDVQKRVRRTAEELEAWVEIKARLGACCVECTGWKHFEFRYHQPHGSFTDARRELISARDTVLQGLREQARRCAAVRRLQASGIILSPQEVLLLKNIV